MIKQANGLHMNYFLTKSLYSMCTLIPGGALPYMYIHGLYRYVRPPKVCFFSHFGHKEGIYFGSFDPKYGVYCVHSCLGFCLFRSYFFTIIIDNFIKKTSL